MPLTLPPILYKITRFLCVIINIFLHKSQYCFFMKIQKNPGAFFRHVLERQLYSDCQFRSHSMILFNLSIKAYLKNPLIYHLKNPAEQKHSRSMIAKSILVYISFALNSQSGCFFLYRKDMAHSMRSITTDAINNILVKDMMCRSVSMNSSMRIGAMT